MNSIFRLTLATLALLLVASETSRADLLWQIGKDDGQYKEFALAGQGLGKFPQDDPTFLIGTSDPAKDWPFIHPGPVDAWAGRRDHTFAIAFGLSDIPQKGDCALSIALVDTHYSAPPKLTFSINGTKFEQQMPPGGGDESARGHPEHGKPFRFDIKFSSDLLQRGTNYIEIINDTGSWVLYDALGLNTPAGARLETIDHFTAATATAVRGLIERDGKSLQPIEVNVRHVGPETTAVVRAGETSTQTSINSASTPIELLVPAVQSEKPQEIRVESAGETFTTSVALKPVRKVTVYVLPHSHNDIGYTDIQAHIEQKQMNNLRQGMEIAAKTADYPPGARFVWNMEVLWAADLYMRRMPESDRQAFIQAVKDGHVALNGMFANTLTGLCRPEELVQLFHCANQLSQQTGVKIDSAMLSDVPGMTWGTSTALLQSGIRYFSLGPNNFDRIGSIMLQWQDKPFWWIAPDGRQKVLVWVPWHGYGMSHFFHQMSVQWVGQYQDRLDAVGFPYDISYIRWVGRGDNALPDPTICDFIKSWNTKFTWPKFVISSTSQAFSTFEKRYGDKLPQYKGDLTPYWEDGAASSAAETAISRNDSERLVQAETLLAMKGKDFPADAFNDAWRNVLLYSEHTWGASMSVSDSENVQTKEQWKVKQGYALDAEKQSKDLVNQALGAAKEEAGGVDVFNTTSWPRTQLVTVSKELSSAGDHVTDQAGHDVPSQRLSTGELAILAEDIPPLAPSRFKISSGMSTAPKSPVLVEANSIDNGTIHAKIDEKSGDIIELSSNRANGNFADTTDSESLNKYVYLPGDNLADLQTSGAASITVIEKGPLVAALRIDSDAPGCNKLSREVRLVAGADFLELTNTIDKKRVPLNPHPEDRAASHIFAQRLEKESLSFAFPFNVAGGRIRLDIPLGMLRPNDDQLPGACKNWLPVNRWADVSNDKQGVTLATLDAPLVELGKLSTLLGSQSDPEVWRKQIEPTQKIYSWVMNNHWGTNYRAYQDGIVSFRYALRPHGEFEPADATRFATGLSQPLIVAAASGPAPSDKPLLTVEPADVIVQTLKPSDDGKATIVRLFGASGQDRIATLKWSDGAPTKLWLSDTSEQPIGPADSQLPVPGWGLVTLRAEH